MEKPDALVTEAARVVRAARHLTAFAGAWTGFTAEVSDLYLPVKAFVAFGLIEEELRQ